MDQADNLTLAWKLIQADPIPVIVLLIAVAAVGFWVSQFSGTRHRDIQDARIAQLKEHNDLLLLMLKEPALKSGLEAIQQAPSKKLEFPAKTDDWSELQKERIIIYYKLQDAGLAEVESTTTATTVAATPTAMQLWDELKALDWKSLDWRK